ncbi:MAG TPA: hypothetical protein VJU17_04275 [Gemmatimonadales bacterium]|nr:hypothetical protein [Gemmatimonadales bacterium]
MEHPPGWTCEKTGLQIEYYLVSRLELADALAVAEHLEACPGCAHQLILLRMTTGRRVRA